MTDNHYWGGAWDNPPTDEDLRRADVEEAELQAVRTRKDRS